MVSKHMSLRQLRGALREHGVSQFDFAQAAGLKQPTVSAALRGQIGIGPERKEKFEQAIAALRLCEPTTPEPDEVIFQIPVSQTSE